MDVVACLMGPGGWGGDKKTRNGARAMELRHLGLLLLSLSPGLLEWSADVSAGESVPAAALGSLCDRRGPLRQSGDLFSLKREQTATTVVSISLAVKAPGPKVGDLQLPPLA